VTDALVRMEGYLQHRSITCSGDYPCYSLATPKSAQY